MSEIPKTPDHCAARDYAHDHGLKLPGTCNKCANPDPFDRKDCRLLGAMECLRFRMEIERINNPPTFDKPEYTLVCGYMEKDGLRFIEQNDDTIRITAASGFSERRDIIVERPKEWINND